MTPSGPRRQPWPVLAGAVVLAFLVAPPATRADEPATVVVYSASVLSDTLERVGAAFTRKTKIPVRIVSGGSGDLATKIIQGAAADIFVAAGSPPVFALRESALADEGTSFEWMSNRIVVIGPASRNIPLKSPDEIVAEGVKHVAIAYPSSVPVGIYARKSLIFLGLWDQVRDRLVTMPDAQGVVTSVEKKDADFGIVYSTDVRRSSSVREVLELPEESHPPVNYYAALIAHQGRASGALPFLEFLRGPEVRSLLAGLGYTPAFP